MFTITESSPVAEKGVPVVLSAVLKQGEFLFGIGVNLNGTLVPSQFNILAKHPDGSVRHALVSFLMDTTGVPGTQHTVVLDPKDKLDNGKASAPPSNFDLSQLAMKVTVIDDNNVSWVKEVLPTDGLGILIDSVQRTDPGDCPHGHICSEGEFVTTLDNASQPHGTFILVLRWRFFQKWGGVRLEVVLESSNKTKLKDTQTKTIMIEMENSLVFSVDNKMFGPGQRFRKVFWIGKKPPITEYNVKQDRQYIRDMNVMSLYDLKFPLSTKDCDKIIGHFFSKGEVDPTNHPEGIPLFHGVLFQSQGSTGDRQDIDPQPEWAACAWNSDDIRGLQVQFAADGNSAGCFPVHIRDPATGEMGLKYDYHITLAQDKWKNPCEPNRAHHALVGFISYILTGDKYYAEELAAWATFCTREWPWDGKIKYPGTRDDAWSSRTIAWGAYILPDSHAFKSYLNGIISDNLDFWLTWVMDANKYPLHTWEAGSWNGSGRNLWPCCTYISPWQFAWKVWSLWLIWTLFNDSRAKTLFDWSVEYFTRAYVKDLGTTFTAKDGQTITWDPKYADQYSFAYQKYTPTINQNGKWTPKPGSFIPITSFAEALWYIHVNETNSWPPGSPYPPFPPAGPEPENWEPKPPNNRWPQSTFEEYAMGDLAPTLVNAGVQEGPQIWSFIEPYVDAVGKPKGVKRVP